MVAFFPPFPSFSSSSLSLEERGRERITPSSGLHDPDTALPGAGGRIDGRAIQRGAAERRRVSFRSVNPATGETVEEYPLTTPAQLEMALALSTRAFRDWSSLSFRQRAEPLRRAALLLRERSDRLAHRMSMEMGKPLPQGRAEAEKCAMVCEYYADHAESFLADVPATLGDRAFVAHRPLGAVLAIMPWNFPFWQVFRFLAPTLMAGNVGLLKHAENVPGCAEDLLTVLSDAGLPTGVMQNLRLPVAALAELIARSEVRAVTLTGSTRAGRAVASAAGTALKKCVLELGGSDPYIVLEDADLGLAVDRCVTSRLLNCGQSCIAAKRFIVVESVLGEFTERVVESMRSKRFGDPIADPDVDLGPMAREDLRDDLHDQVMRSVDRGTKVSCGGTIPAGPGWFYPATVLVGVEPGSPAYSEETFGPVASIISAKGEEDAVLIANDTCYGLGAAVFTRDIDRGERIARDQLEAGCCFVNDFVRSDPRIPFGGIRDSGFGRELAREGIHEFINVKSIVVQE